LALAFRSQPRPRSRATHYGGLGRGRWVKADQVDRDSKARDYVLEADIRKNSGDIRKNSEDIRVLTTRVDALGPLDQRVSAIERRLAGEA